MKWNVVSAVFRRNFSAYFSSPTGYVFICVFVLLSAIAAFWPNEFFNANLANLDQLNRWFPYIMLVFVPAITMSIWADERRQGTDELLLTIPASDLDVVLGKYLAAVGIYTTSLLFSLLNIAVLRVLGEPDLGLLLGNYLGYWFVGLAMLAIGMSASFLTSNLTVGFILGAVFNLPLIFAANADAFSGALGTEWTGAIKRLSISEQFRDFGRGVASLSSISYFLLIVVVMLYVSMILIGRRHWMGGRDGRSLGGHYLVRVLSLALVVGCVSSLSARYDRRWDLTSEKLSSLSSQARKLLKVDPKRPVRIEAFISPTVPESYVQTRLNLLTMLREIEAGGRGSIRVTIHPTEQLSEEAAHAEQEFGIKGREVASRTRGAMNIETIYMGVAFLCGLEKVVVPFFDRGVPVEYEVIRSVATVSQQERKKLGVLLTDAKLYGGFDMQSMSTTANEAIIDELEKQYEVVQVNADTPITQKYDVLLAVQPSSLTQPQMDNFLASVRGGQATAVFEDPFPYIDPRVPGTSAPKQPAGGNNPFMNQGPPQPKGDITPLWEFLGVSYQPKEVVFQTYNPYPKISQFPPEFVFIDTGTGQAEPFNADNPITSELQQMLFLFAGYVRRQNVSGLDFTPLVRTGSDTGEVDVDDLMQPGMMGGRGGGLNSDRTFRNTRDEYVLAARIQGKAKQTALKMQGPEAQPPADAAAAPPTEAPAAATPATEAPATEAAATEVPASETPAATEPAADAQVPSVTPPAAGATPGMPNIDELMATEQPKPGDANVVLVADIDVIYSAFIRLRDQGDDPDAEVHLDLDNVSFVLNVLDDLAGDDRFVEIRKRRRKHRILKAVETWTEKAKDNATDSREEFIKQFNNERDKVQASLDQELEKLRKRTDIDNRQKVIELQMAENVGQQRLQAATEQLKTKLDRDKKQIDRSLALEIRRVQDRCKMFAVLAPPILPLVLGCVVFYKRRAREREGVSKTRLR